MVESTRRYTRTPEERADQARSWNRPDTHFFAAGACHVLADAAAELTDRIGELVVIEPVGDRPGLHAYYRLDGRSFDFNGWADEADLLATTWADYRADDPTWEATISVVDGGLEALCRHYPMRPPEAFAQPPKSRALAYARRLGITLPPDRGPQV